MKMTWNKFWTKKVKEIIIIILKQITENNTVALRGWREGAEWNKEFI